MLFGYPATRLPGYLEKKLFSKILKLTEAMKLMEAMKLTEAMTPRP